MQIISTIFLCNYKVPVITTKKNFTFCPGKSQENFPNFFQDLETKFKDFPGQKKKIQDFSRMWQPCKDFSPKIYLFKQKLTEWWVRFIL